MIASFLHERAVGKPDCLLSARAGSWENPIIPFEQSDVACLSSVMVFTVFI